MKNHWTCLEMVAGLSGLPVTWQTQLGEDYEIFKGALLQSRPDRKARFFPCPNGCPSWHQVFCYGPQDVVAVSRCESSTCGDLRLSQADVVPLELSWPKLARGLGEAFGIPAKLAGVGLPWTRQIGTWSTAAIPILLTIQISRAKFRAVVASLVARLRQPFILLTPSNRHWETATRELLTNIGAGCFSFEAHLRLSDAGKFLCAPSAGELFRPFTAAGADAVTEQDTQGAVAIMRTLDGEPWARKAPVYKVFRLFCVEGLNVDEVAKKCRCARSLIYTRLERLRQKLGRDPAELRQYSAQFERIEESLSDSRARSIYRKGAVYGDEGDED